MSNFDPPVTLTIENGVAILRLNRPAEGNALSLALVETLSEFAGQVAADPEVRCVLLTASGRYFCVGGDIGAFRDAGDDVSTLLEAVTLHMHRAISLLAAMDKPLVVAVNGPAAGAGLGFAALGDIVLAAASAHFTMAYTAIGLTPDGGTSILLPRLIGLRKTQELALTNRRVSAEEAAAIGLISRVVADEDLETEARAVATGLAAGPTRAYGAVRRLLARGHGAELDTHLSLEARCIGEAAARADGKEGIAAFLAKRKPAFQGL